MAGCAIQPIALDLTAQHQFDIPFQSVEIDNYASTKKVSVTDVVWTSGWVPTLHKFNPELHEVFAQKLRSGLKPSGPRGTLSVAVLDTGFFVEMEIVDSIVFLSLLAAARDRGFKCTALVSIKANGKSERRTFEFGVRRREINDGPDVQEFMAACHNEIARQVAEFVSRSPD